MQRWLVAWSAAFWLFGAQARAADVPALPAEVVAGISIKSSRVELQRVNGLIAAGNMAEAAKILEVTIASPAFPGFSDEERHAVFVALGWTKLTSKDGPTALAMFKAALASPKAVPKDWLYRLTADLMVKDFDDAMLCVRALVADSLMLKELDASDVRTLTQIFRQGARGEERVFDLMSVLLAAHWTPAKPEEDASDLWLTHVTALLEKKDLQGATAAAEKISAPFVMVRMRADKRFDAITATDPARFDPVAAADRRIAKLQAAAAAASDRLAILYPLADTLVARGRAAEALALLEDAIARAEPKDGARSPFTDVKRQLPRIMQDRAAILALLGRGDDAAEQMRVATERMAAAGDLRSWLNLARFYDDLGRPKDALAVLDKAPPEVLAINNGTMALGYRICAYAQLNDQAAVKTGVAEFRKVNRGGLVQPVALCTDDFDEAARLTIEGLARPANRAAWLQSTQDYAGVKLSGAWNAKLLANDRKVLARRDVRDAIAKVGRIEHYDLTPF